MLLDTLYPHQIKNSETLAKLGFGGDFSDTGTGKTVTAFATMAQLFVTPERGAHNILVVAPKSAYAQWENKFNKFFPEVKVYRPSSSLKTDRYKAYTAYWHHDIQKDGPRALVATYDQIRLDIEGLKVFPFDVVYADEIHKIGNPLTRTSKAMTQLKSMYRFGATATPMRSSPLQIFGIFDWLKPGLLGSNYYSFQARYAVKKESSDKKTGRRRSFIVGFRLLEELGMRIKPFYVATTMEESGIYMPEMIMEDVIFKLSPKEQKLYDNIKNLLLLEIENDLISKVENPSSLRNAAVNLGKLQELTDSMELLGEGGESSKLDLLKDSLESVVESGDKAVVFTHFARMAKILARELAQYNPALITGAVADRQAEISKFDNDPSCKVMIITEAGNESVDLQVANILYMYDVPVGTYGSLVQTIGRIRRAGQTKNMVVYYLMAEKTVDIRLKELLISLEGMSNTIFKSLEDIKNILS